MDRSMKRLSLLFLVLFALALGGVRLYDHLVMEPAERCVREGGWYDEESRVCARPVYLPDITNRAPGESREEASRRQNQEMVRQEREYVARQQALEEAKRRDADEQRQRLQQATGR
jgi:hypothetical protein